MLHTTATLALLSFSVVSGLRTPTGAPYYHEGAHDSTSPSLPTPPASTGSVATWEWIEVEGTQCMDKSQTGFWHREGNDPSKLLVYLMGGGACFNPLCKQLAASNPKGPAGGPPVTGILRPNTGVPGEVENPLGDYTVVFIPYCTGDVFFGNQDVEQSFGLLAPAKRIFKGRDHVTKVMEAIKGSEYISTNLEKFVVTGESAGGFGSLASYDFLRSTYFGGSDAGTHWNVTDSIMIDDSGVVMNKFHLTPCLTKWWMNLFNLDSTLPDDCPECRESLYAIYPYLQKKYPDDRFAFISTTSDTVITLFYSFGFTKKDKDGQCGNQLLPGSAPTSFKDGIKEFFDDYITGSGINTNNWASYFFPGTDHTHTTQKTFFFRTEVFNDLDGKNVTLVDWYQNILHGYAQDVESNLFDSGI